jgi:hypothetical protein
MGANLADPAVMLPAARIAIAGSYDLGGYTITNDSVPCIMNRFHGSVTYAPFPFLNIGFDAGASQMDVAADTTFKDTIGVFHGNYGFSGGLHLKLGSEFFYDGLVRIIGLCQATYFTTSNAQGAVYSGKDVAGVIGLQFHINHFGYVSTGPQLYLIEGDNKSYNSSLKRPYSNVNNLRGWLAFDYFPQDKLMSNNKLFISFEMSVSPKVAFNKRAPLQEASFSISLGSITKRLYGEESEIEWAP